MMSIMVSSFLMVFVVFTFILYIYILIDILKHEFTGYNKIIWILVLIFFPVLGALLYLVFGRSQRIK
ncbi:MAG: PLDc N-terminal domain-containing protein [Aliarcobacter sp.]|nr:PLDc N-terminal domain-containing protein [Aliarcobacter sp.]